MGVQAAEEGFDYLVSLGWRGRRWFVALGWGLGCGRIRANAKHSTAE